MRKASNKIKKITPDIQIISEEFVFPSVTKELGVLGKTITGSAKLKEGNKISDIIIDLNNILDM